MSTKTSSGHHRRLLSMGLTVAGLLPLVTVKKSLAQTSSEQEKQEWMASILGTKAFGSPSVLSKFSDGVFYLRGPLQWASSTAADNFPKIEVPTGFVTDLASIPQPFWSVLPRDGKYADAAIVHDFLYWEQEKSKAIADQIFDRAMRESEVSNPTIAIIMAGVQSWFGDQAWKKNKILKESGELRILKKFPTQTNASWVQWKSNRGNFR